MSGGVRDRVAGVLTEHRTWTAATTADGLTLGCRCGAVFDAEPATIQAVHDGHRADVLLAEFPALGGVTAEMVEAGARELNGMDTIRRWENQAGRHRDALRGRARAVLVAALGGEATS